MSIFDGTKREAEDVKTHKELKCGKTNLMGWDSIIVVSKENVIKAKKTVLFEFIWTAILAA